MATDTAKYKLPTANIWFPEQVEPDPDDKVAFKAYWKQEKKRIKNGFYIADGQVYISGWLYWYTVYWIIERDIKTNSGRSFKGKGTPTFRDIEWEVACDIERAEKEQKMYVLVGSRGFGKSNICASITGRMYNFYSNTECVISGGFDNDINLLAQKIDLGLSSCHPCFHRQRVLNNWGKEVRSGWKDRKTGLVKGSNSRIIVRNYDEGNNTMAANGTRPKVQIIDEIGKIPNLVNCVLDTVPCWMNDYGMFSIPILAGTGGDMEKGADAAKIFRNPKTYNVLEFNDEWEGQGSIGKFIPVTKALNKYKEPTKLSEYLGISHPDLDRITIDVSNEELAKQEYVIPRREKALLSTTSNEIIKEKAYYPLTPSEAFLTVKANDFPVEICTQHRQALANEGFRPLRVELYRDTEGKVQHKFTDKMPVTDFPVVKSTHKEGVIEVVEFPISNAPFYLYIGGADPYKVSESDYSDSLGSVIIWKRMSTSMTETFQDQPVAWYTGRPKDIHEWYENALMLIEWYNASTMIENIDFGFIQYIISKNKTMFLAQGQSFLKEISPNSKSKAIYGLPPTIATITHWNNTSVIYTKEEFAKERDEQGKVIKTHLGVTRVLDPMLLTEMIAFNKHEGNFDRVRAFGIAAAYARQLDAAVAAVDINRADKQEYKKSPKTPFFSSSAYSGSNTSAALRSPFIKL